tara:strand:- start:846 stop:1403 length:558 start_codon:yes stop_codon:yes gene_type:complete
MAFEDSILTFEDDKIISGNSHFNMEVMMDWESPIMGKSAEYICQSKGDILEIGFGMGICADYIQAQGVNSHTIIEIHPQILERLNAWASGKSNITIIEGDWSTVGGLSTYDGIFLDTFGDDNLDQFKDFATAKARSGAKVTYWNNYTDKPNKYSFDSIAFEDVSVSPDENTYFNSTTYSMPKIQL